jgi:MFS family permease
LSSAPCRQCLGFLADAVGRKPTAILYCSMCLVLTPLVYLWGQSQEIGVVLFLVVVFGFFSLGIWAWAPVWLPELYPTRMRATAVAFVFNAPRFISCVGPLIAGTLIVALGGYWLGGDLCRAVLSARRIGSALFAGNERQAAAARLLAPEREAGGWVYRVSRRLSRAAAASGIDRVGPRSGDR